MRRRPSHNLRSDLAKIAGCGLAAAARPAGDVGGRAVRVGAVQYLNTKPLVHGLASFDSCKNSGLNLSYDLPSRLADQLSSSALDVALIPIVEVFRGDWRVITDACIGCRGPVMSVKLFFRTAPQRVTRIALDEGSRTSAALAQVLLAERFGVRPAVEPLPIGSGVDATAEREQRTVMVAPTMSARLIDKAHGREVKTAHPWVEADARSSPT